MRFLMTKAPLRSQFQVGASKGAARLKNLYDQGEGTNGRMYKATSTGWVEVNSSKTLFLNGTPTVCNYNFGGQDDDETMYIVNGIDKVRSLTAIFTLITTGHHLRLITRHMWLI